MHLHSLTCCQLLEQKKNTARYIPKMRYTSKMITALLTTFLLISYVHYSEAYIYDGKLVNEWNRVGTVAYEFQMDSYVHRQILQAKKRSGVTYQALDGSKPTCKGSCPPPGQPYTRPCSGNAHCSYQSTPPGKPPK